VSLINVIVGAARWSGDTVAGVTNDQPLRVAPPTAAIMTR
jgi:hypothetical protein